MARVTGLEPATSGVTGRHSNRLSYTRASTVRVAPRRCERWIKRWLTGCQALPKRFGTTSLIARKQIAQRAPNCLAPNPRTAYIPRLGAISSVGRALRLHRRCRRFEPVIAHHPPKIDSEDRRVPASTTSGFVVSLAAASAFPPQHDQSSSPFHRNSIRTFQPVRLMKWTRNRTSNQNSDRNRAADLTWKSASFARNCLFRSIGRADSLILRIGREVTAPSENRPETGA